MAKRQRKNGERKLKSTRFTDDYVIFNATSFMCQWQRAPFTVDEIKYMSAEQWMMAEKARLMGDEETLKLILNVKLDGGYKAAATCQALGRSVKPWDQQKWDKNKQNIVYQGTLHKFKQNPDMAKKLLSYDKNKSFVSYGDNPWGIGMDIWNKQANSKSNWRGQNLLGIIITMVRDQLMIEQTAINRYPAPITNEIDNPGEVESQNVHEHEVKENKNIKGYQRVLLDLMNDIMTEKQAEFQAYFYRNFNFDSIDTQNNYYKKLCKNGVNSLELLMCCDDNKFLTETVGLNMIHAALFTQRVDILKSEYKVFESWLYEIKMNEYLNIFRNRGILTFELFYNKIDGFQDLLNIIGAKNQIDAHLLWDNTPKAKRHTELQYEGK